MKAVTIIITILAVAGQSLAADLQSHPITQEEEALLARYLERTQAELENRHMDSVNSRMHDKLDHFFTTIHSKLTSEAEASIAEQSVDNLPIPEGYYASETKTKSANTFG